MDDLAQEMHEAQLIKVRSFKGKLRAEAADIFAKRNGVYLQHYDPVNDSYHFTDGEVYSGKRIVQENFEALILKDDVDDPLDD